MADSDHELRDILGKLNGKIFNIHGNSEGAMIFVSVIVALMELYDFDEQDFIKLWRGEKILTTQLTVNLL